MGRSLFSTDHSSTSTSRSRIPPGAETLAKKALRGLNGSFVSPSETVADGTEAGEDPHDEPHWVIVAIPVFQAMFWYTSSLLNRAYLVTDPT
jgi:hypothetical protein